MTRAELEDWALDAFAADLRVLAAFRIGLGGLLLYDLAERARDLTALYTDAGAAPLAALLPNHQTAWFSLHAVGRGPGWVSLMFLAAAACAAALAAGWRTRWAAFGCWVMLISLHNRQPLVLHGSDALLRLMSLWTVFVPSDAVWSLESRRAPLPAGSPRLGVSLGTAALTLQPVVMYLSTFAFKFATPGWRDGSLLGWALTDWFWAKRFGMWLAAAAPGALKPLCWSVLGFELLAPLLILVAPSRRPWPRLAALAGLTLMQAGFGLCLFVGFFPAAATLSILPLLRLPDSGPPPERPDAGAFGPPPHALAAAFVVAVVCGQVLNQAGQLSGYELLPRPWARFEQYTRLDNRWDMFASVPRYTGWFVLEGLREDGQSVDLLTGGPLSWKQPQVPSERFPNARWSKYLYMGLMEPKRVFPPMLDYELRDYRARFPDKPLKRARLALVWKPFDPKPGDPPLQLWTLAGDP